MHPARLATWKHYDPAHLGLALSLCTTVHPLHTRFTDIFGTSISETTMRPNPRRTPHSTARRSLARSSTSRRRCPTRPAPRMRRPQQPCYLPYTLHHRNDRSSGASSQVLKADSKEMYDGRKVHPAPQRAAGFPPHALTAASRAVDRAHSTAPMGPLPAGLRRRRQLRLTRCALDAPGGRLGAGRAALHDGGRPPPPLPAG